MCAHTARVCACSHALRDYSIRGQGKPFEIGMWEELHGNWCLPQSQVQVSPTSNKQRGGLLLMVKIPPSHGEDLYVHRMAMGRGGCLTVLHHAAAWWTLRAQRVEHGTLKSSGFCCTALCCQHTPTMQYGTNCIDPRRPMGQTETWPVFKFSTSF